MHHKILCKEKKRKNYLGIYVHGSVYSIHCRLDIYVLRSHSNRNRFFLI